MPAYQPKSRSLYYTDIQGLAMDDEAPIPPPTKSHQAPVVKESTVTHKSEIYSFSRDALASARLNLQHQVWITSTGYLLHPSIRLPINPLIADIACGTGIWSLSLCSHLPAGGRIEAFDLSLSQTPPKEWTPENITFRQLDILGPIPSDLIGIFDIVNLRLFMCVIANGDPMPLLHNLMKLLKPGGYLQWQEYDPTADKLRLADPSTISAPKLVALQTAARADIAPVTWISTLSERFADAGGELVKCEKVWTKKEALGMKQDIMFLAVREWAANLRGKGEVGKAEELEGLCEEVGEECWGLGRGSVVDSEMVTWVVRKSM